MLTRRKHHVCRKLHFQRWFQAYDDLLKRVTTCPEITSAIYLKSSLLSIFSKCDILSLEMLTFGLIQQIFFAFTWLMSLCYWITISHRGRVKLRGWNFLWGVLELVHIHSTSIGKSVSPSSLSFGCSMSVGGSRMLWVFVFFKWVFNFFKHKSAGTDSYRVPNVSRVSKILHKTNLSPLPQHRRMTEG